MSSLARREARVMVWSAPSVMHALDGAITGDKIQSNFRIICAIFHVRYTSIAYTSSDILFPISFCYLH